MLAMEVNDDAGSLAPRGALRFFASMLAPTGTGALRFFKTVNSARQPLDVQWMSAESVLRHLRNHCSPEQPCRLVRLDMENLPSTGESVQQGGHDKPGDALATKAPTDEQITDVEAGIGHVDFVIHGDEPGQLPIDPDQKCLGRGLSPVMRYGTDFGEAMPDQLPRRLPVECEGPALHKVYLGRGLSPVIREGQDIEKAMLTQLRRHPLAEVIGVELHQVFNGLQFVALGRVQFNRDHLKGSRRWLCLTGHYGRSLSVTRARGGAADLRGSAD